MANTTHYNLKLFKSTDHPTWLTDWNNTITNIDNALYRIATGGGDLPDLTEVVARLQALEGRVDSDELRLNVVESDIVSIFSDLQNISDDITALASRVTVNESDIADLKTQANTTLPGQISSINDSITSIIASVSANTSAISGLDTRVTALENAGGGGLTITKLNRITDYYYSDIISLLNSHDFIMLGSALCKSSNPVSSYASSCSILSKDAIDSNVSDSTVFAITLPLNVSTSGTYHPTYKGQKDDSYKFYSDSFPSGTSVIKHSYVYAIDLN